MNSFGSRSVLRVGSKEYEIYRLKALDENGVSTKHLPYSLRILLENLLRTEDGRNVTENDVRALAKEGVTFGSHGAGHHRLDQLSVPKMLAEASLSRERIAAEVGGPVSVIAYPYGAHNDLVRHAMEGCGFGCAVTTDPGLSRLGDDHFGLPRQEILGTDQMDDFISKLGSPQRATIDRRIRYYLDSRRRRNLWA